METVEGRRPVYELLKSSQRATRVLIAKNLKPTDIIGDIEALARKQGVRVDWVDKARLDEMAQSRAHQGVIAEVKSYHYLSFAELAETLDVAQNPVLLLLDGVTDPQNLGAIIRTADAAAISGIIVAKKRVAPVTAVVHKASAGATAYVKIAQVSNLVYTIEDLKEMGFWIIGTSDRAEMPYFEADFNQPLAIVLGSEGKGISRLVGERCDFLVSIPMRGHVESLNVSVAGALLMYEALRQRFKSNE